jgi:hypothetical protein
VGSDEADDVVDRLDVEGEVAGGVKRGAVVAGAAVVDVALLPC